MHPVIHVPAALVGLAFVALHILKRHRLGLKASTRAILLMLLNAQGLVLASLLIVAPFSEAVWSQIQDIKLYIFIVGVVATITHWQELFKLVAAESPE